MKKVIDDKLYDTELAEKVCSWENGYPSDDFKRLDGALYRTRNGAWFMVHSGGAKTEYARQCGNSFYAGTILEPVNDCDAFEVLSEHGDLEGLQKYFSDRIVPA